MSIKIMASWVSQIVLSVIMFFAGITKIIATDGNVAIFSALGMEPGGRILIGIVELAVAGFAISSRLSTWGAILGLGTMIGAFIAHATKIGFVYNNDGGKHMAMLAAVVLSGVIILLTRKNEIPLLGKYLPADKKKSV